jgi:DNA-binding XRE family transcriptional regulator
LIILSTPRLFSSKVITISIYPRRLVPKDYSPGDCLSLNQLGRFAKKKRKARGDTQKEAAVSLGVKQPNVSRAENGRSDAKDTLFRLIERYSALEVDRKPRYYLTEKKTH